MISTKSESDVTSLAPSSPSRSPKRPYYVQSPSSNDGDKSLMQATPIYNNSPTETPSRTSFGRHSRNSSTSRFSGTFQVKGAKKINDKGWPECDVILEEGSYDEFEEKTFIRRFQAVMALLAFVIVFTICCLIVWGASRHYKPDIVVKSLAVNNFYVGEGSDFTGVITKMVTVNCSLKMNIYNPATLFGIHVSSSPVNLVYSEIAVATGQVKKYFQQRKSHRSVSVDMEGIKVPLYGAGSSLAVSESGVAVVAMKLEFDIKSRGNVVGKLVRTKHRKQIECSLVLDSSSSKTINFKKDSCTYT